MTNIINITQYNSMKNRINSVFCIIDLEIIRCDVNNLEEGIMKKRLQRGLAKRENFIYNLFLSGSTGENQ